MQKGNIYSQLNMQLIWRQFHLDPHSLVYSDDNGETWNEVPSMDTGKWKLYTIRSGLITEWVFKVKEKPTLTNK